MRDEFAGRFAARLLAGSPQLVCPSVRTPSAPQMVYWPLVPLLACGAAIAAIRRATSATPPSASTIGRKPRRSRSPALTLARKPLAHATPAGAAGRSSDGALMARPGTGRTWARGLPGDGVAGPTPQTRQQPW